MNTITSFKQQYYESNLSKLHESIFSNNLSSPLDMLSHSCPFKDAEWKIALVPYGIHLIESDFLALAEAAKQLKDQVLIIINSEVILPDESGIIIPWSYQVLKKAIYRRESASLIGILDTHMFGYSGKWGAISACSLDDFLLIGGVESFISDFLTIIGGEPVAKRRFLEFAQDEWCVTDDIRDHALSLAGWLE